MSGANVISMAQYAKVGVAAKHAFAASPSAVPALSIAPNTVADSYASYGEDGPENVLFVSGSERKPAHLSHVFSRAEQLPMIGATPLGDAALDGIYRLLKGRKTKITRARPAADVWRDQAK